MTKELLTTTVSQYDQHWTFYLIEQYSGHRTEQLSPTVRQWCDAAVVQRMARTAVDRSTVLQLIEQELRGETPDQQRHIMVPNQLAGTPGAYVIVVDDQVQCLVNERGKRVWSVLQEPPVPQP